MLGPEVRLALAYAPTRAQARVEAVWTLDARMRAIGLGSGDPTLAQIKLAWWEERLSELTNGRPPAEPLLRALAPLAAMPGGAEDLAALASAWRELGGRPWTEEEVDAHVRLRGRAWIAASARALAATAVEAHMIMAEGYVAADLARSTSEADQRAKWLAIARARFASAGRIRWPRALRPAGMIVELARRDASSADPPHEGAPGRVARMMWHAATGR